MAPVVLTAIGGCALIAPVGRRPIVIGESRRREAWSVIMLVADVVGQPVPLHIAVIADVALMVPPMIMARIREAWRQDGRCQHDGGQKLRQAHFDSPEFPLNQTYPSRFWCQLRRKMRRFRDMPPNGPIFGLFPMLNDFPTQSSDSSAARRLAGFPHHQGPSRGFL